MEDRTKRHALAQVTPEMFTRYLEENGWVYLGNQAIRTSEDATTPGVSLWVTMRDGELTGIGGPEPGAGSWDGQQPVSRTINLVAMVQGTSAEAVLQGTLYGIPAPTRRPNLADRYRETVRARSEADRLEEEIVNLAANLREEDGRTARELRKAWRHMSMARQCAELTLAETRRELQPCGE